MIRSIIIAACVLLLSTTLYAHSYWIETEGNHKIKDTVMVKLFYGEYAVGEKMSGKALDKMAEIKMAVTMPDGSIHPLVMKQDANYWQGIFVPKQKGVYTITGINDTREVQDWTKHNLGITRPVQYLKMEYAVGSKRQQQTPSIVLDVITKKLSNNNYEITAVKNGVPIPMQKMVLASFGGEEQNLTTDAQGKTRVTIKSNMLYTLGMDWIDNTPGTFRLKAYETVRYRLDVSLWL